MCRHAPPRLLFDFPFTQPPCPPLQPGFDYTGGPWKLFPGEPGKTYNLFQDGAGVRTAGWCWLHPALPLACWSQALLPAACAPAGRMPLAPACAFQHLLHKRLSWQPAKPAPHRPLSTSAGEAGLAVWCGRPACQRNLHSCHLLHTRAGGAPACIAFCGLARSLAQQPMRWHASPCCSLLCWSPSGPTLVPPMPALLTCPDRDLLCCRSR